MHLSNIQIEILSSVIRTFMDDNSHTRRKELVVKYRDSTIIDGLINLRFLKELDNERNLAPWTYAIELVADAETKMRAKAGLEITVRALQQIYEVTPERKQVYRSEVLAHIIRSREQDVSPHIVDRGLYFIQEFEVLDGYGPESGNARQPLFNLHWMVISERVMALDPKIAWESHTQRHLANVGLAGVPAMVDRENSLQLSGESEDRNFARMAIAEAKKSVSENDGRPHPRVGAVVVKNGLVISTAYRGEFPGNHAEFIALEKKLGEETLAGATVFTTLEPCTTRNPPKVPCATRLAQRKIARVVIGMLDPDTRISGKGQRSLRKANIVTDFFPADLMAEVEEMNREFTEHCERQTPTDDKVMAISRSIHTQDYAKTQSLHRQLGEGKSWVEETLVALLTKRGLRLDSPIAWTADEGREIYTLEASINGLRKLWRLSYEALEDCITDRNIQRTIRRSLNLYFVPDFSDSQADSTHDTMSEEQVVDSLGKHQAGETLDQLTLDILDREGYITTSDVTNMDSIGRELLLISITAKGLRLLSRFKPDA